MQSYTTEALRSVGSWIRDGADAISSKIYGVADAMRPPPPESNDASDPTKSVVDGAIQIPLAHFKFLEKLRKTRPQQYAKLVALAHKPTAAPSPPASTTTRTSTALGTTADPDDLRAAALAAVGRTVGAKRV